MTNASDIKLLASSGEGYNVEFKVSIPAKVKELTEEICAFANAAGGVSLIGVNDANQIVGANFENSKRSAIQNSLQEISPRVNCSLEIVEVDGKQVGVIEVASGNQKPYVLSGAIYMRIGPNTQKLTTAEQMRDFFQLSERIYFDEIPCPDFDPETMVDEEFLPIFKAESKISQGVPNDQLFRSLKLFGSSQQFKNGAVLFFGKNPERLMEKAVVRCIAFDGKNKRFIVDDQIFGGNLFHQYQQTMQWLRQKLSIRYEIESQGSGPRKEIWEIPETALKEAIINALSHRDYYEKGGVTHVELFDDRVEITNPGGLVSAIPEEQFGKRSHSRNPLIFGLFARMHLVEQVGSGIGRMMEMMTSEGLPQPEFQKKGIFGVIFGRLPEEKGSEKTQESSEKTQESSEKTQESSEKTQESSEKTQKGSEKSSEKIISLLRGNPTLTIEELSETLGKTTRAIEKQIQKLREKNKIERVGPDKGGYWQVLGDADEPPKN